MHNLSESLRNVQSHSTEDFITLLKEPPQNYIII